MVDILVVDDDYSIRLALRLVLEDDGYQVFEASDGKEALNFLRCHATSCLVLLDFMMPRLSGADLLRTVSQETSLTRRHIYALVSAVRRFPPDIEGLLPHMGIFILHKPFEVDELHQVVTEMERQLKKRALTHDDISFASNLDDLRN